MDKAGVILTPAVPVAPFDLYKYLQTVYRLTYQYYSIDQYKDCYQCIEDILTLKDADIRQLKDAIAQLKKLGSLATVLEFSNTMECIDKLDTYKAVRGYTSHIKQVFEEQALTEFARIF